MASPADALRQLYSGYVGALQGVSDFLKDDLPSASPGIAKWAQETGRRACRKYARQRGNIPFLTSDPSWDGICSGYWNAIAEGPTSGGFGPSWTGAGGQCDGKLYGSSITYRTGFINTSGGITWGAAQTSNANCGVPGVNLTGPVSFTRTTGSGGVVSYRFQGKNNTFGSNVSSSGPLQILGTSLSLCPGQGTESGCPLPPQDYRPPQFPDGLPPLSPPTNPAPGLGNGWEVNLLPDGQINICIAGDCSGGIPPGGGSGPDSGGGPGEPDGDPQETDPNDPDNPNEVSGCVADGNLLTGIKINFTEIPPHQAPLGEIYYRVCWVWMGPDSDKLDMVVDGRTMRDGQFVIPDSRDCTCYKVRANAGWRLEVQPYSRPKEK